MFKKVWLYIQYYAATVILAVLSMFVWGNETYWHIMNNRPYWVEPSGARQFFREGKEYMDQRMEYYLKEGGKNDA